MAKSTPKPAEPSAAESSDTPAKSTPKPAEPSAAEASAPSLREIRQRLSGEMMGDSQEDIAEHALEKYGITLPTNLTRFEQIDAIAKRELVEHEAAAFGVDANTEERWDVWTRTGVSRRRGGLRFGSKPRTIDPTKLAKEMRDAIEFDPVLLVKRRPYTADEE